VRILNTIVCNAVYYFQITKKEMLCVSVSPARDTRETDPVVDPVAGMSNFTK